MAQIAHLSPQVLEGSYSREVDGCQGKVGRDFAPYQRMSHCFSARWSSVFMPLGIMTREAKGLRCEYGKIEDERLVKMSMILIYHIASSAVWFTVELFQPSDRLRELCIQTKLCITSSTWKKSSCLSTMSQQSSDTSAVWHCHRGATAAGKDEAFVCCRRIFIGGRLRCVAEVYWHSVACKWLNNSLEDHHSGVGSGWKSSESK